MKHFKLLLLVFSGVLLFYSCRRLEQITGQDVRSFIPGTYVNYAEGEFSVAYDTLLIQPMDAGSDAYRIYRNTAFRRVVEGKLGSAEQRHEKWLAVYDEKTRTLLESKKGKTISIFPDSGLVVVGSREYRKVEKE